MLKRSRARGCLNFLGSTYNVCTRIFPNSPTHSEFVLVLIHSCFSSLPKTENHVVGAKKKECAFTDSLHGFAKCAGQVYV